MVGLESSAFGGKAESLVYLVGKEEAVVCHRSFAVGDTMVHLESLAIGHTAVDLVSSGVVCMVGCLGSSD